MRIGFIVQADLTRADGHAQRNAALDIINRHSPGSTRRLTLGADKGYDSADFVAVYGAWSSPRISHKRPGIPPSTAERPAIPAMSVLSQRARKKIEEPFGWAKTVGGMAQTVHRGIVRARFTMTMAPEFRVPPEIPTGHRRNTKVAGKTLCPTQ